ncbi:hypothetical protein FRC09_008151 [Ceratobasidium sp. 395]|nr:hypothetical protein FRC09_008151 [Ceratobasidium sp. 395]
MTRAMCVFMSSIHPLDAAKKIGRKIPELISTAAKRMYDAITNVPYLQTVQRRTWTCDGPYHICVLPSYAFFYLFVWPLWWLFAFWLRLLVVLIVLITLIVLTVLVVLILLLMPVFFILWLVLQIVQGGKRLIQFGLRSLYPWAIGSLDALSSLYTWIISSITVQYELSSAYGGTTKVPMDLTTSQMLAWLIANCEDSRSVDIALQAIAGADDNLPTEPLAECRALELVLSRLDTYVKLSETSPTASLYYRVYGMFASIGVLQAVQNRWGGSRDIQSIRETGDYRSEDSVDYVDWVLYRNCARSLVRRANIVATDSNARAVAVIASAPYYHLDDKHSLGESTPDDTVVLPIIDLLKQYLRAESSALSTVVLEALVQSTIHYFVGRRSREERNSGPSSVLTVLLSHIFFASYHTSSDIPRAVAITLATAAFAVRPHPGGEEPSDHISSRQKRAVDVYKYYYAKELMDRSEITALFIFGFSGLLSLVDFGEQGTRATIPGNFKQTIQHISQLDYSQSFGVRTYPEGDSLKKTLLSPAVGSLRSFINNAPLDYEATIVYKCLPLLIYEEPPESSVYLLALTALCRATSVELQELCLCVVDSQLIPGNPLDLLKSADSGEILGKLCCSLIECNTAVGPVAALHFGLLVAKTIVYAADHRMIPSGRSVLQPLLDLRDRFTAFETPKRLSKATLSERLESCRNEKLPAEDRIHLIMQSVVDFCGAGVSESYHDEIESMLQERLEESLKPSSDKVVRESHAAPESHAALESHPATEDHSAPESHPAPESHQAPESHPTPESHPATENHPAPENHPALENHPTTEDLPAPESHPASESLPAAPSWGAWMTDLWMAQGGEQMATTAHIPGE